MIRSLPVQPLPCIRVDVVHDPSQIPLCEIGKDGSLGQDHPEKRMRLLDTAILTAGHRVTVIDAGPPDAFSAGFQRDRIAELRAPVGQDDLEQGQEVMGAEDGLQTIKSGLYGAFRAVVQKICKEESRTREIERQDALAAIPGGDDGVHLDKRGEMKRKEVLTRPSDEDLTGLDVLLLPRLAGLEPDLALQVDVSR